ncbi:hypothetical protein E6H36_08070 [Candidatus Bathyarchaeota archaeon]|nr:MAG: hypothetical protein E6H36_08070 [Candidatus Bathyarchaeota archaeon]
MSSSPTPGNASNSPTQASGPASPILQIALRDISVLFRTPWIIISRSLAFIIQLFVFAFLISELVVIPGRPSSYFFEYYAVGSVVGTIASISFIIGYDIFEEAEEGVLDYLLTLPVSRRQFIIGRALGGAIRAMIYIIPMFVIVAVLEHFNNPASLAAAVLDLFLLAFGVTGLSITVAVSVRSANRFDVVLALLELAVSRASTALYPIAFMPSYVSWGSARPSTSGSSRAECTHEQSQTGPADCGERHTDTFLRHFLDRDNVRELRHRPLCHSGYVRKADTAKRLA